MWSDVNIVAQSIIYRLLCRYSSCAVAAHMQTLNSIFIRFGFVGFSFPVSCNASNARNTQNPRTISSVPVAAAVPVEAAV